MPLNLHLLRLFSAVVRTGSFSRAANLLHISQPAISKGVRDFELQVGCRLLDRTPKGVRPTREGQALARHAEALFAAEHAAEDELRSLRSLDSGSLRVGASTTIATYMIAEYLGTFHRAYPGIDLHVVSANTRDIADLMVAHEIEIALVEGPVEDENLISEAWRTDLMGLIAAPDHRFAVARGPIDCRLLEDEILIVREPGSGTREVVAHALAAQGVEPKRTLEIGSTEAIKQAVAAGIGVAIVSTATIDDQVKLGRLKVVPIKNAHIERTLWQLKTPGRLEVPAAIAFERIIRDKLGKHPARHRVERSVPKARRASPVPTQRRARS
jgi:DNA-binding transcriptional LysR family regulator